MKDALAQVKCLKMEEMLASKLKCLIQRRHSADLFDFVHATFVSPAIDIDRGEIVSTFLKMTIFRPGPRIVKGHLAWLAVRYHPWPVGQVRPSVREQA